MFCRLREESVAVGTCCACVHCDAIRPEPSPSVDCTVPLPPEDAPDPRGEHTAVGGLLRSGITVLDETCSVRDALSALQSSERGSIAVVDEGQVLVGIVHEISVYQRPTSEMLRWPQGDVTAAMSSAIAIDESTPIRTALRLLASTHSREATVITPDGRPLGIFRDIDGMSWIFRTQHASEARSTDDDDVL